MKQKKNTTTWIIKRVHQKKQMIQMWCQADRARWFKVPFSSPSWRSLNPLKGSLNHPKKVTLNHQGIFFSKSSDESSTSWWFRAGFTRSQTNHQLLLRRAWWSFVLGSLILDFNDVRSPLGRCESMERLKICESMYIHEWMILNEWS